MVENLVQKKSAPERRSVVTTVKDSQRVLDRREQLVSAAMEVFLQKGFHQATVRDIGTVAGMTQGTIYNYVRSKDDILYLVCDHVITAYQTAVREAIYSSPDRSRRFKLAIRALIRAMYEHQEHILLMYQEGHALDRKSLREILVRVHNFNNFIEDLLKEHVDERRLAIKNRKLAINIVTFLPAIVALRRWELRGAVTFDEALEELTAFLLRGLGIAET